MTDAPQDDPLFDQVGRWLVWITTGKRAAVMDAGVRRVLARCDVVSPGKGLLYDNVCGELIARFPDGKCPGADVLAQWAWDRARRLYGSCIV